MSVLADIIVAILRALLPALFEQAKDTAEDGRRRPKLRDDLRKKVLRTWGSRSAMILVLLVLPGCGVRTVYVRDGEPVRLREAIPQAKVWVLDTEGKAQASTMDLPEGWYCLPVPDAEATP